jgi:hypothetical protein
MNLGEQKRQEEERRERHFDPAERWRAIQEAITWAEAQQAEPRNCPANRLREQQEKLSRFSAHLSLP